MISDHRSRPAPTLLITLFLTVLLASCGDSQPISHSIQFEDWSEKVGLDYQGETWGASWRDFDQDGYPDFFISHHFTFPPGGEFSDQQKFPASIYRNLSGKSIERLDKSVLGDRPGDWHGASWVDFDNDGDADIFVSRGGNSGAGKNRPPTKQQKLLSGNLFFVQENGGFVESGSRLGLSLPRQRGRRSSWFDVNNDGLLDVFLAHATPKSGDDILYLQQTTAFKPCLKAFPTDGLGSSHGVIFSFPGFADDLRHVQIGGGPGKLFRYPDDPRDCEFIAVPEAKGLARRGVADTLLADLDGDLALDLFSTSRTTVAALSKGTRYFRLELPGNADLSEFSFQVSGKTRLAVRPVQGLKGWWNPEHSLIFIGAEAKAAPNYQFDLNYKETDFQGAADISRLPAGVFIHYDPETLSWNVRVRKAQQQALTIDVDSSGQLAVVQPPKIHNAPHWKGGVLAYTQGETSWTNAPESMGLRGMVESCTSVVAADFDNDMDVDLLLACRDNAANRPNILLANQGGRFVQEGDFGAEAPDSGLIDSVSTGDFDRDGFPDLLITNGASLDRDPLGHGHVRLYHNQGNSNNWLRVALVGTRVPRDAFGSRVFIRTDGITQMRYASGGVRATAQDEPILHFGLGTNTAIDPILVAWSDGSLESFPSPQVNLELRLVQGKGKSLDTPVVLTSAGAVTTRKQTRFLLLRPKSFKNHSISWDINGQQLQSTSPSINHVFGNVGKKQIGAHLRSPSGKVTLSSVEVVVR